MNFKTHIVGDADLYNDMLEQEVKSSITEGNKRFGASLGAVIARNTDDDFYIDQ
tara:strand:- start:1585 stop:1746 length:162 start_codon:yes stop_codon:yes gene_type:complete